jgi:hypothetical protein
LNGLEFNAWPTLPAATWDRQADAVSFNWPLIEQIAEHAYDPRAAPRGAIC